MAMAGRQSNVFMTEGRRGRSVRCKTFNFWLTHPFREREQKLSRDKNLMRKRKWFLVSVCRGRGVQVLWFCG